MFLHGFMSSLNIFTYICEYWSKIGDWRKSMSGTLLKRMPLHIVENHVAKWYSARSESYSQGVMLSAESYWGTKPMCFQNHTALITKKDNKNRFKKILLIGWRNFSKHTPVTENQDIRIRFRPLHCGRLDT